MKGKMKLQKKIALAFLILLLLGAGGIYAYAANYFTKHFYQGSKINGMDCSYKTVSEVKREIEEEIGKYTLTLKTMEGQDEVIEASQIKLAYVDDNKVDTLLADQQPLLWFMSFGNDKAFEMTANTTYDQALIDGILESLDCFNEGAVIVPQNAYIQENENDFEIIPEIEGNQLDFQKVKDLVIDAVDTGKTEISLVDEQCYNKPTVYQDDHELSDKLASLNELAKTSISYDFGDNNNEVINWGIIKTWITQNESGEYLRDDAGVYALNKDLVAAGIASFGERYDTHAKEREFQTYHGQTVTLPQANYGWQINKEQMTEELFNAIIANEVVDQEVIYTKTAKGRRNTDMGGTYVEISISEQRMWCYQDGSLKVDTPIVTGNISRGWDTPKGGIWSIFWRVSPHTLKGEVLPDGTREYEVPVTYWMPFNKGIGIHDMPTRSAYGGDIYLTGGSRGCINTPYEAAKQIYEIVSVGTPVVVY